MTKKELEKEATSTIEWESTSMIDRPLFVHAYITGAEPREKRIKELEKEIAELKGEADDILDNWCRGDDPCPHLKKRDEQLTKAKEIIKDLLQCLPKENIEGIYEITEEAEEFIREVETKIKEMNY